MNDSFYAIKADDWDRIFRKKKDQTIKEKTDEEKKVPQISAS